MAKFPFWTPRYKGKRFDGHTFPIECLKDLIALKEILDALAAETVRKSQERIRVPRNFFKSISLDIDGIKGGSAALSIVAVTNENSLVPPTPYNYYGMAKESIIKTVKQAQQGQKIDAISAEYLDMFDKLGRGLRDDEQIDLDPEANDDTPAIFTQETRKKILGFSSNPESISKDITLKGKITDLNTESGTFCFTTIHNSAINSPVPSEYFEQIHKYLAECDQKDVYVQLTGVGKYKGTELIRITEITTLSELDDMDISTRLVKISRLEKGWMDDGVGEPVNKELIVWLDAEFEQNYDPTLPAPYLYPTEEGGISSEWNFSRANIALEFGPSSHIARLYVLNKEAMKGEDAKVLDMDAGGWSTLKTTIDEWRSSNE